MNRFRDTRGSAIVTVVFAIFLAVLLGTVAVSTTVGALKTTQKNERLKRAQQAAESAIDAAIFGLNRLDLVNALNINPLNPTQVTQQTCLVSTAGGGLDLIQLPVGQTWCPTVSESGASGTWSYRISQLARVANGACGINSSLSLDRKIVAVGQSGDVTRRVSATLRAPVSLLSGAAVQSGSTTTALTMSGLSRVTGNVHANAAITGTGGAPVITGSATAGPGFAVSGVVPVGGGGTACQRFNLPEVDQGSARTTNNNGTEAAPGWQVKCAENNTGLEVNCKPALLPFTGGADYSAANRTLRVWGNAKVILTGSTYSFCRLRVEGEALLVIPASTAVARIFLDDPAACPGVAGAGQVTVDTQARIVNCHPATDPGSLQLYAVGSSTLSTTHTFAGAGTLTNGAFGAVCGGGLSGLLGTSMILYAPRSRVDLASSTTISGQVAAGVVNLSGAASVNAVSSLSNINELGTRPVLPLYRPTAYVSCTSFGFAAVPSTNPSQGC